MSQTQESYSSAWQQMRDFGAAVNSRLGVSSRPPAPMNVRLASALPAFARGVSVIAGMGKQMPLDVYRGVVPLTRPIMLEAPDPDRTLPWFLDMHLQDFIVNGNAVHLVTSRNAEGWPASVVWVPAQWVTVIFDPSRDRLPSYWVGGDELPFEDVVHVQRGADPWCPWRGIGVVEQHLASLSRVTDQELYESEQLRGAGVPSVAITAPNSEVSQQVADEAAKAWLEKHSGPGRRPAILPAGTVVTPLSWSPHDSEMVEARRLSLLDVANLLNLDGYWVGAPGGSFNYRSPGPMYLTLLRQSVNPLLVEFEASWSAAWLPRGRRIRFDRTPVLQDDLASEISATAMAVKAGLWTLEEGRTRLGLSPTYPEGHTVVAGSPLQLDNPGADVPTTTSPVGTTTGAGR